MKINDLKPGDIFSEISHYTLKSIQKDRCEFLHHESKQIVTLDIAYVENLLACTNTYDSEVKVGMEDKLWTQKQIDDALLKGSICQDGIPRVGDVRLKGIRTIWEEIYSAQVFTVAFKKAPEKLSDKKFKELKEAQVTAALTKIEETASAKKGVAREAKAILEELQNNPVQQFTEGELRVLRGYKTQFTSRDGKYQCVDMDISPNESQLRPVNINTIQWLIFNNVKYILE